MSPLQNREKENFTSKGWKHNKGAYINHTLLFWHATHINSIVMKQNLETKYKNPTQRRPLKGLSESDLFCGEKST